MLPCFVRLVQVEFMNDSYVFLVVFHRKKEINSPIIVKNNLTAPLNFSSSTVGIKNDHFVVPYHLQMQATVVLAIAQHQL